MTYDDDFAARTGVALVVGGNGGLGAAVADPVSNRWEILRLGGETPTSITKFCRTGGSFTASAENFPTHHQFPKPPEGNGCLASRMT